MEKGRICVENFIGELFSKALGLLWCTIHVLRIGQKLKKRNTIGDPWYFLRQLLQMECFPPAPLTSPSYPGKIASPVYHVASYSYRVSQKKSTFLKFQGDKSIWLFWTTLYPSKGLYWSIWIIWTVVWLARNCHMDLWTWNFRKEFFSGTPMYLGDLGTSTICSIF